MAQTIVKKSELNETIRAIATDVIGKVFAEQLESQRAKANEVVTSNAAGLASAAAGPARADPVAPGVDGDEKVERKFGLVRWASALGMARNNHEEALRLLNKRGYKRTAERIEAQLQRALTDNTLTDGGVFAPPEYSTEFIEMLRNTTVVKKAGARVIPLEGTLELGRQNTSSTASWGEEGATVNGSQPTFGNLRLTSKKLTILTPVGNGLIRKANVAVEQLVQDDLLATAGVAADVKYLRGDGTASAPRGIRSLTNTTNVFAMTATPTVVTATTDLFKLIRYVKQANLPVDYEDGCFIISARIEMWLMSLRDGNNNLVFKEEMSRGRLCGFKYFSTEQVPSTLGGGTESEVYFALMKQVIIGDAPAMQIDAFPGGTYSDSTGTIRSGISTDETVFRMILYTDIALRHDKAAAVLTGVTWGA